LRALGFVRSKILDQADRLDLAAFESVCPILEH
jgi:hypothetical protein